MPTVAEPDFARLSSLIDAGRPLSELVPLFPNRPAAYHGYAEWMATRFGQVSTTACAACGHASPAREEEYRWEATVNTRRTILWSFLVSMLTVLLRTIYTRVYRVRFVTRHRFCAACTQSARRRRWLTHAVRHLCFALLITSLLAIVPLTIFALAMVFAAPDLVPKMILFWLAALLPLSLSVAGVEWCRRFAIPTALRHIGRFPFVLHDVTSQDLPSGQ